jgi:hypothetical protein
MESSWDSGFRTSRPDTSLLTSPYLPHIPFKTGWFFVVFV